MARTKPSRDEARRIGRAAKAVGCRITKSAHSLAEFLAILSSTLDTNTTYWFRGHADTAWGLTPTALRYRSVATRERALALLAAFKRVAEMKLPRPPGADDELGWCQIAQHYGLPTRLLDWTENPQAALFFACGHTNKDGLVFVLNPVDLNRLSYNDRPRVLDANQDAAIILEYLRLGPEQRRDGLRTVAINPVWNSDRIVVQKGAFTLHGSRDLELPGDTPSLAAVPIPRDAKDTLRAELERVAINEMTIFPELEHTCAHLTRRAKLEDT
jgi:hypothetical protein